MFLVIHLNCIERHLRCLYLDLAVFRIFFVGESQGGELKVSLLRHLFMPGYFTIPLLLRVPTRWACFYF